MKVSVIFSTYNSPKWLEKVLWGFLNQTVSNFEIVIADDGSSHETLDLIERVRASSSILIRHVWQEDDGFQKCRILNKAILASSGDYLIFTDGDCIPRADFIEQHLRHANIHSFLSGGYFKLPMGVSEAITEEDVQSQRVFDSAWLEERGVPKSHKNWKLMAQGFWANLLNLISPAKPTWNGHNASCHKAHVLAINGFDERMQYGGEDCEFGDRLCNFGIQPKRIRYSAVCVHLDHARGYVTPAMLQKNQLIRLQTQSEKRVRSPLGLDQYL
ncbi:glycosyltransferase family 2 protein [Hydrogenophaga sp. PAMC20947]|uniref:glycosyltransferase family 2 protein n=1 Tax=Hydrogenophaga sp. PAMC20947 TaxID=2565558 RepID=UPI00109DE8B9|nr:glycosyltransferase family 2 protein [Hydrogenophaga sp. PAMC20947]QCB46396.1 glycosyltransferase [Hydrogenophaga sp. PAMC20947]